MLLARKIRLDRFPHVDRFALRLRRSLRCHQCHTQRVRRSQRGDHFPRTFELRLLLRRIRPATGPPAAARRSLCCQKKPATSKSAAATSQGRNIHEDSAIGANFRARGSFAIAFNSRSRERRGGLVQTPKARAKPCLRAIAQARGGRTGTLPDASRARRARRP